MDWWEIRTNWPVLEGASPSVIYGAISFSFRAPLKSGAMALAEKARPPRVLFADDNYGMHRLVHMVLGPAFEIVDAFNGQEMLDRIPSLDPDLLLVDINMPVLGGLEAVQRLSRDGRPAVLFLTAEVDAELLSRMRSAGAQGCVLKATADEYLLPAIHAALKGENFFPPSVPD